MEEVRAAAMANYANMSVDRKQAVQDFYRALDVNGDGKVTRQEYLDALEKNGWNQNNSLPSNLFEVLDKNHDGTLDLEECVTFYYMIAGRRLVSCDACRSYMLGLYFLCVKCYDDVNKEKTYKLCCPCYHNKHFKHGHSYFLDNFVLLRRVRTKLQEGNTSAGPRRSSSISVSSIG
ncbi:hypothetical protein RHMOL_Rhmol02G0051000 [Rhododendron molle]|uniref:Uncharacterized protein n=1 Tax=Rhododendron molle TaxID=49168 RepID=A0ACC0PLG6_RHOML|nr:hypothetical protein RHMOL_Rhmol02G0051000 [Rhododendron molle]